MHLPNYKDGSILNLASTIIKATGGKTHHGQLSLLPASELKGYKNIILIIIDGMGFEFLSRYGRDTELWRHARGKITSVFPSTTAAAMTTYKTGLAPNEHALTGWNMLIKETGTVATILRMTPRLGGAYYSDVGVRPEMLITVKGIFERIPRKSFSIMGSDIAGSGYNQALDKKATILTYDSLAGMFSAIKRAMAAGRGKRFIGAYWPMFDNICHHYSQRSSQARRHILEIDREFVRLIRYAKGKDTAIIVCADHGHLDIPESKKILLKDHPKLAECLTLPFCGETRLTYCYVHPEKAKQFESYVRTRLGYACQLRKSSDLIRQHYFGLGKDAPSLADRVGDYTLIMKDGYVIKDTLLGQLPIDHKGSHGGVSKDEMYVPLIVVKP